LTLNSEDQSPANFNIYFDDSNKGFQMIQTEARVNAAPTGGTELLVSNPKDF
jgi:hypothetical protein